jgi:hypothetical protein
LKPGARSEVKHFLLPTPESPSDKFPFVRYVHRTMGDVRIFVVERDAGAIKFECKLMFKTLKSNFY